MSENPYDASIGGLRASKMAPSQWEAVQALRAEIESLRAQLLAARAEAFEEAAKLSEGETIYGHPLTCTCEMCEPMLVLAKALRARKGASLA